MYQIKRGNTEPWELKVEDDGQAIDLINKTVQIIIKEKTSDPDADALYSVVITDHFDAENGITFVMMTSEQTKAIKPGVKYFAIRVSDESFTSEYATAEIEFVNNLIKS